MGGFRGKKVKTKHLITFGTAALVSGVVGVGIFPSPAAFLCAVFFAPAFMVQAGPVWGLLPYIAAGLAGFVAGGNAGIVLPALALFAPVTIVAAVSAGFHDRFRETLLKSVTTAIASLIVILLVAVWTSTGRVSPSAVKEYISYIYEAMMAAYRQMLTSMQGILSETDILNIENFLQTPLSLYMNYMPAFVGIISVVLGAVSSLGAQFSLNRIRAVKMSFFSGFRLSGYAGWTFIAAFFVGMFSSGAISVFLDNYIIIMGALLAIGGMSFAAFYIRIRGMAAVTGYVVALIAGSFLFSYIFPAYFLLMLGIIDSTSNIRLIIRAGSRKKEDGQ